jgi:Icc-related predicted phosphoesterase
MKLRRNGQKRERRVKILFVTDLHGSEYTFGKLLRALPIWKADALIVGGDVAGKGLLPILRADGALRLRWMGEEITVSAEELPAYETRANQLGFYPYVTDGDELAAMRASEDHTTEVFERLMADRWASWLEQLEARCGELELPAFVIAGNDDPWTLDDLTFADRDWVTGADGRVLPLLDDYVLLSCGLANQTPWDCPRDTSEAELTQQLTSLANQAGDLESAIANIHVPPYGSALDVAPRLDTSVSPPRPITGETAAVGSTAVMDFLREFQPLVSLHGHIHESPGTATIGRTRAINPGSEYAEGILRGVLVTLTPTRVVGHQFVTG